MNSEAVMEAMLPRVEYPCLMISKGTNSESPVIVFFTSSEQGTVVWASKESIERLGERSHGWNMDRFTPWYGSVVLTSDLPSIIMPGEDDDEDLTEE